MKIDATRGSPRPGWFAGIDFMAADADDNCNYYVIPDGDNTFHQMKLSSFGGEQ